MEIRHAPSVEDIGCHQQDVMLRQKLRPFLHGDIPIQHRDLKTRGGQIRLPLAELVITECLHGIQRHDACGGICEQNLQRTGHENEALAR